MREGGYRKGPSRARMERRVIAYLNLEASQSKEKYLRLEIGCYLHPNLATMLYFFTRLL